jgi:hypothetical protein
VRRTLAQERRQITPGEFARRNIAQRNQTERFCGGARFFAPLIVETLGQLPLFA